MSLLRINDGKLLFNLFTSHHALYHNSVTFSDNESQHGLTSDALLHFSLPPFPDAITIDVHCTLAHVKLRILNVLRSDFGPLDSLCWDLVRRCKQRNQSLMRMTITTHGTPYGPEASSAAQTARVAAGLTRATLQPMNMLKQSKY